MGLHETSILFVIKQILNMILAPLSPNSLRRCRTVFREKNSKQLFKATKALIPN
jgi:hypothetical protein